MNQVPKIEKHIQTLLNQLDSQDKKVRIAVLKALGETKSTHPYVLEAYEIKAMDVDEDVDVRTTALSLYARMSR